MLTYLKGRLALWKNEGSENQIFHYLLINIIRIGYARNLRYIVFTQDSGYNTVLTVNYVC